MQSVFFHFVSLIERALRLIGLDVYTDLDDSGLGFLAFERRDHGAALGIEYWGLGLHVIVSPLRVCPRLL